MLLEALSHSGFRLRPRKLLDAASVVPLRLSRLQSVASGGFSLSTYATRGFRNKENGKCSPTASDTVTR